MKPKDSQRLDSDKCISRLSAVEDALYVIGGKWKLRIIIALMEGPKRFNELQRTVKGISAKVLSSELKMLEINGFVTREVYTGSPVAVEYQLTDYSSTLHKVLDELVKWGNMHREKVKEQWKEKEATP
ncbi:winged helix-turn-helix transcriptional regulator [Membranihabitans maritimus]|uniref:winged helix-turn-helix transcriptional regulator n=1 Tax=Membranihabitans maritimus TaxID=2904244 RepID=UPI001F2F66BB|nr:helix-turn-helix domain-containing protein [Membranihabitans maritimus]